MSGTNPRALAALAVAFLILGAGVGFALGRGTAADPTLAELAAEARGKASSALSALELVTIEYPEAVRGGEVVAETEYEAAVAQAASASDTLAAAAPDLGRLDPEGFADAEAAVDEVERLIAEEAESGVVEQAARDATQAVEAMVGTRGGPDN